MRQFRSLGSARGAARKGGPYRDPGRGCHDAIGSLFNTLRGKGKRVWILDADLAGAFDKISHEHLLEMVGGFPAREMIVGWLKAGIFEAGKGYSPTEEGNGLPGPGVPAAEGPGHRVPVAGIVRPAPGQRAGRIDRGVRAVHRVRAMGLSDQWVREACRSWPGSAAADGRSKEITNSGRTSSATTTPRSACTPRSSGT